MQVINIKEYGGEVKFTGDIASNKEWATSLLEAVDCRTGDFEIRPEVHTTGGKRVDLVVTDKDGETIFAIECQDATGYLDDVHASKIMLYCYDRNTTEGVIICEDIDENIRDFVKYINTNTPFNLYIVSPIIVRNGKEHLVTFKTIMRPYNTKQKQQKSSTNTEHGERFYELHKELFEEFPGQFTNHAKYYCSTNNLGKDRTNVDMMIKGTQYVIRVTPSSAIKNRDITILENSVLEFLGEGDWDYNNNNAHMQIKFDKTVEGKKECAEYHKNLCEAIKQDKVVVA